MPQVEESRYLCATWDLDRAMALAEFIPLLLTPPAKSAGYEPFAKSLSNLYQMADSYRAVTRLSFLANDLSRETLGGLMNPRHGNFPDRLEVASHVIHVLQDFFENTAVFAGHGVFPRSLSRFGGCAVTCWFYTLLLGLVRQVYLLTQKPNTEEEKKRGIVTLVKLGCFFIFSMTCIPKDGPMLLENGAGVLTPVHNAIRLIAPKHIALDDSIRGALGFIASVCDFY